MKENKAAMYRRMIREGRNPAEIAEVTGVSERTIYRAIEGMDIQLCYMFFELNINTEEAIKVMRKSGYKPIETALKLGISQQYANRIYNQEYHVQRQS